MGSDLKVRAPITGAGESGPQYEWLHANRDPAAEDQAVLVNTPAYVDGLNYGDIVKVSDEGDILEVVHPSGHRHIEVVTGQLDPGNLVEHLLARYPDHALRMEGAPVEANPMGGHLSVSVHPAFMAEEVREDIIDWIEANGGGPETQGVSPTFASHVGPLEWPRP